MNKKNNFIDDLNSEKLESFQEEEFIKQKKNLIPTIIFSSTLLIIMVVLLLIFTKGSTVPDMIGWKENDVSTWGKNSNAAVVYESRYSDDTGTGEVIEQQLAPGSKLKRNGTIIITISRGADPNENIVFPDVKEMNLTEINRWINENKLSGISIKKENSTVFEKDAVINYDMVDGNESDFIRKNRVKIYVSLGSKELSDTVTVIDFTGKVKADAVKWANENSIEVSFVEEFNEYVGNGLISAQSIEKQTKMSRDDTVVLIISLGKAISVSDFVGMSKSEAVDEAGYKNIKVYYKQEISLKKVGTVLGQDIEAGSLIHDKEPVILLIAVKSEYVTVPDFTGLSSDEAATLANIHSIRTFFIQRESIETRGVVFNQNIEPGSKIGNEELVTISVSRGNVLVPDFSGMTKSGAEQWAYINKQEINFVEMYSDELAEGTLFQQSHINILLPENEILTVYCSLGKVGVKDFTGFSKLDILSWQQDVNSRGADISLKFHVISVAGKEANEVVDQSIKADNMSIRARLDVWLTADESVEIPDMTAVKESDFISWCNLEGVPYKVVDQYSSEYNKDMLFGQNYTGTALPSGSELVIYKSLGKPKIVNLGGFTKAEAEGWINTMNLYGANLTAEYKYQHSDGVREGSVVSQNPVNKWVEVGSVIKIYLSLGAEN